MYTICDIEYWNSEFFDLDYCMSECGLYGSYEEALIEAKKKYGDSWFVVGVE